MQTKTPRFQLAHRGSVGDLREYMRSELSMAYQLTLVLLAIGADLVSLEFEEILEGGLVLRRPLGRGIGRSSGHAKTCLSDVLGTIDPEKRAIGPCVCWWSRAKLLPRC